MPPSDSAPPSLASLIAGSYALEQAGEISAALHQARQALSLAMRLEEPEGIAAAQVCLALCQYHLGHYPQATDLSQAALTQASPASHSYAEALRLLGNCAHEAGDLAAAESYYHQAIDIARSESYPRLLLSSLHSLAACVYLPRGQFELALAADEESFQLAVRLDLPDRAWYPLETIAWIYRITGQTARAQAAAQTMSRYVLPGSMAEGYYFCLRGELALDSEDLESAAGRFARARSIAELLGDPGLNAELRLGLSRCRRLAGDAPAARRWAEDALATAQRSGSRDLEGAALIERARAAWSLGDLPQAEADLLSARQLLETMPAHYELAQVSFFLAALYLQESHPAADAAWLEAVQRLTAGGYTQILERERRLAFPLLAHYLASRNPELAARSQQLLQLLANVPPPPLTIAALGKFTVLQGHRLIPDSAWRQRKAGELFRFLLISPRRTPGGELHRVALRDQVFQALWPASSPASLQASFHQATSALRKALEPDLPEKFPSRYLAVEGGEVSLRLPEGSQVDFETFSQLITSHAWAAALELYQGDLYPGDLYADWPVELREALRQQALQAALALAREKAAAGESDAALAASRKALSIEPWQEEAALLAMQSLVKTNDRLAAIRLYQQLARSLQDELGVQPGPELHALYRSLL